MGKPNLFIVGAPKCGTTSLHYYLDQHPDVYMSPRKEPCYFASEFVADEYPKTEEDYLELFTGANTERYLGEATSTYLYSRRAACEIYEFCPHAKIIIMLRNPADMIYSLHAQRLFEGSEDIYSFEKALIAEPLRKAGGKRPPKLKYPLAYLHYREMGNYLPQVQRFFDVFPESQIQVIVSERFRSDKKAGFEEVLDFLELPHFHIDYTSQRLGKKWIIPVANDMVNHASVKCISGIIPKSYKQYIKSKLLRPTPKINPSTRARLLSEYSPSFKELEALIGCELESIWN